MTVAATTAGQLDQIIHLKVSWAIYEALLAALGDQNHVRLNYDGETLEIMSPGTMHEFLANLVSEMLTILSLEWRIFLVNLGSATIKTEPKGFEADKTYYVNAKSRVRDLRSIDVTTDPPPDLLVEIDISNSSRDKLPIYAALGVMEVWRYHASGFAGFALAGDAYIPIQISHAIRGLPLKEIGNWLTGPQAEAAAQGDMFAFALSWQNWAGNHRGLHALAS